MPNESTERLFRLSRVTWTASLLIWLISELLVMHVQLHRQMYSVFRLQFYYRPLMMILPLACAFGTFRRLENILGLRGIGDIEQLSRGFGFVTLIFYLGIVAAMMEFGMSCTQ